MNKTVILLLLPNTVAVNSIIYITFAMNNQEYLSMRETYNRSLTMPPIPLINISCSEVTGGVKLILYSPAEVLNILNHGYSGKVIAAEWMDGIVMGRTSIPVFMVQPADGYALLPEEGTSPSEMDAWEVAKEWMDLGNMPIISEICNRIVECNYEISYEF